MPKTKSVKNRLINRKDKAAKNKPHGIDFPMLLLSLVILAYGLIMVQSAGAIKGFNMEDPNAYYYLLKQLKWAGAGLIVIGVAVRVPYTTWRRFAGIGILLTLGLLLAVIYSKAGVVAKGSARWLNIVGFSVQPSEIAKIGMVLFLAHVFDKYPVRKPKDVAIPGVLMFVVLVLIFKQPDLGTTMVLAGTCAAMLWETGLPAKWFFIVGAPLGIIVAFFVRHTPYQWERILAWLHPWDYTSDLGYQITNAEISFGTGGIFGIGLAQSVQKSFLPENHTDTIFAMVGEEFGLVGCLLLITLFVAFFWRCYYIARLVPDRFGRLMAFGLTSALAIQTAVNLAVVTGVFPVTGITLPLVSYGGSSLMITMAEIGVLLNISRYAKKETPVPAKETKSEAY